MLINPHFICIHRDLDKVAQSSIKHDKDKTPKDFPRVLKLMQNHQNRVKSLQSYYKAKGHPVISFNLSDIKKDPQVFIQRLEEFCNLGNPRPQPNYDLLQDFISGEGGYHNNFLKNKDLLRYYDSV